MLFLYSYLFIEYFSAYMTWDDYYERFYDLSLSTQKGYAYKLTSYGDAEEVFEVLSEFAFYDKQFATRFASKAVDGGVHFSPDHVLEMALLVDKRFKSDGRNCGTAFDAEQLEEIYMLIDDASFARISKKQNIDIFSDEEPGEELAEPAPAERCRRCCASKEKIRLLLNTFGCCGSNRFGGRIKEKTPQWSMRW